MKKCSGISSGVKQVSNKMRDHTDKESNTPWHSNARLVLSKEIKYLPILPIQNQFTKSFSHGLNA